MSSSYMPRGQLPMKKIRSISLTATLSFVTAMSISLIGMSSAYGADQYDNAVAAGEKAMKSEKIDEALKQYTQAYAIAHQEAQRQETKARIAAKKGKHIAIKPSIREAQSLTGKGLALLAKKKVADAEKDLKKALAIYDRAGKSKEIKQQDLMNCINGLCVIYSDQNKADLCLSYSKRLLSLQEKNLKKDDPQISITLYNIALIYFEKKAYTEAETALKRCLEIRQRALGPIHPAIAEAMSSLAGLYDRPGGKPQLAETMYKQTIDMETRMFKPDNPLLGVEYNNLAECLKTQKKYPQAEVYYKKAIEVFEKNPAPKNPELANVFENYAQLLKMLKRDKEAIGFENKAKLAK